jgi:transposase
MRHKACGKTISPYKDTLFCQSQLPASLWLYAMLHVANSRSSVGCEFLCRHLGIHGTTVRRMLLRIRLHLAALDHRTILGAPGERVHVRVERPRCISARGAYRRKIAQLLCLSSQGEVRTVVSDVSRPERLSRLIAARVHPQAVLFTDCHRTYRLVGGRRPNYRGLALLPAWFVQHRAEVDWINGFVSSFSRGLRAQHKHLSVNSLWLYLKEYEFRYNRRHRSHAIFGDMIDSFPALTPDRIAALEAWNVDLPG